MVAEERLIEVAARAAYRSWVSGVECAEPAWEDLPESFRDRLIRAQRDALMAFSQAQRDAIAEFSEAIPC